MPAYLQLSWWPGRWSTLYRGFGGGAAGWGVGAPYVAAVAVELPGSTLQLWPCSCLPGCWSTLSCGCGGRAAGCGFGAPYITDVVVELLAGVLEHPMLQLWQWSCWDAVAPGAWTGVAPHL